MKSNHTAANFCIAFVSIIVGVIACEAASRFFLNPADYLSAKTIEDKVLGITIAPNSSGFDEWGFRNRLVPTNVDIVAIGDSHTFGNTATMNDSWPSVVARVTGRDIYNLGLGGYGPNQYYHLLITKAFKLHPKLVICGLYMGDDFENAFSITYGLDSWSSLRNGSWDHVDADIWGPSEPLVWGAGVRNWLSENSMVYRIVFHGPFLAMVKENIRFREASSQNDQNVTTLIIEDKNIREAFRPIGIANRLDQTSAKIREGMRITFHLIKEMDKACKQEGCRLLVVIIPTKETVFSDYLENNPKLHLHEALDRLIANERSARHTLIEFLAGAGIAYMDTLPKLSQSVSDQLYAQTTRDMHPGKNGYRIIGEAVADYLNHFDFGS